MPILFPALLTNCGYKGCLSHVGTEGPAVVHYGLVPAAIEQRRGVLNAAYGAHPDGFVRRPPQPLPAPGEVWINKPKETPEIFSKLCFRVSQTR